MNTDDFILLVLSFQISTMNVSQKEPQVKEKLVRSSCAGPQPWEPRTAEGGPSVPRPSPWLRLQPLHLPKGLITSDFHPRARARPPGLRCICHSTAPGEKGLCAPEPAGFFFQAVVGAGGDKILPGLIKAQAPP